MHCRKISPEFECQGHRSRSPRTKKTKKCGIFVGSRPLGRGSRASTPVGTSAHAVQSYFKTGPDRTNKHCRRVLAKSRRYCLRTGGPVAVS